MCAKAVAVWLPSMSQEEFKSMLPEYVSGNLSADIVRKIEKALTDDVELQREHDFLVSLRAAVKQEKVSSPAEWGLMRLQNSLQSENLQQKKVSYSWWKPLAVAASFAFVMQTAYLMLNQNKANDFYVPLSEKTAVNVFQLVFSEGVAEEDMRELLLTIDGRIVDGPSVAGIYRVQVGDVTSAQKILSGSHLINHVAKE